jgi:hypothetical protein
VQEGIRMQKISRCKVEAWKSPIKFLYCKVLFGRRNHQMQKVDNIPHKLNNRELLSSGNGDQITKKKKIEYSFFFKFSNLIYLHE